MSESRKPPRGRATQIGSVGRGRAAAARTERPAIGARGVGADTGARRGPGPSRPASPAAAPRSARGTTATPAGPSTPAGDGSQKLQKVLAQAGLGSRREMEVLIAAGKVLVNGVAAGLGDRVTSDDEVKVGRRHIRFKLSQKLPRVIVYHKPEGEIVSRSDPEGRASVFERLPVIRSGKWLAIGRLDFNTCGLLIFTTSGELANRMTHPRFEVEREYAVRVMGALAPEQERELRDGVKLADGLARFDLLEAQGGQGSNRWYRVVVREGRNRLVRRLFEHFGLTVSRLMRVRFGILNMPPRLKRGQHLELTEAQTRMILEWLATGRSAPAAAGPKRPAARPKASAAFGDDGPDWEPVPRGKLATGATVSDPAGAAPRKRADAASRGAERPAARRGATGSAATAGRGRPASAETPRRPRRPSRAR